MTEASDVCYIRIGFDDSVCPAYCSKSLFMRKTAYLLATTLLAVTFCADRAMAATPAIRPEVVQLAEKLVSRLSQSFSRTAVAIVSFPQRQPVMVSASFRPIFVTSASSFVPPPLSPFEFRLPPPAV
jgi:hypothetical protein